MAECRRSPGSGAMTVCTCMTEIPLHMIGIDRLRESRRVASVTISVLQLVVAIRVALGAQQACMCTRERKFRCGMAERRRLPCRSAVALGTRVAEICLDVIGIHRLRKYRDVTCIAVCILQLIIPVHVALRTR